MRRLMLVVIAAGMISLIPSSAHAYQCVWFVPGEESPYPGYNRVFTGEVLENEFPHRPVLLVDTVLRGMKLKAGSVIQLRLDGWWPPHLMKGQRYTVQPTTLTGHLPMAKRSTPSCSRVPAPR
jgi:hypothetical protein